MQLLINDFAGHVSAESFPSSVSATRPFGTIACLAMADMTSITFSLLVASIARDHIVTTASASIIGTLLPALILVICSFTGAGLYPGVSLNPVEELRLSSSAITLAFLALFSGTFFLHDLSQSRLTYGLAFLIAIAVVPCLRFAVRKTLARQSWWGFPVVILGYGKTGRLLVSKLKNNPGLGLRPYAVLDDNPDAYSSLNDKLICGPISRCLEIASAHRISYGIVCMPGLSRDDVLHLLDRYAHCFAHVLVIPNLIGISSLGICAREVDGIVGLEVRQELLRPLSQICKRVLDLLIVAIIAPFIALAIAISALIIKCDDAGPVFYADTRVGKGGRTFRAWKLRSMAVNGDKELARYLENHPDEEAYWNATQKLKRDPRVTRVGRIMRKTSIDELPQMWNVMMGQMSLVGPRPILEKQIPLYGPSFRLYKQVRPGITGLWQVSGRNELAFKQRVELDRFVIQNWSVWLDVYILARTFWVVLTAKGAY